VVAKGAGVLAERIKEMARRHGVPILERRALTRAIYRSVGLEKEIPPGLFVAVAEVIAFVHNLRNPGGRLLGGKVDALRSVEQEAEDER
jgi:flagellar biosynthetic protein FlhB